MSGTENPAPRRKFSILRFVARLFIGLSLLLVVFFFVFPLVGGSRSFTLLITLALGWLEFLSRTLPRITLNADLLGMGIMCIVLILLLAHQFLRWISASIASTRKVAWRWPWKWTWCGLCAVLLLFLIGMAMGGVAHQIGWIASSPEPWYELKGKSRKGINMQQFAFVFRMAMDDAKNNFETARRMMMRDEFGMGAKAFQDVHFLFIMEGTNTVAGFIIFPRDPEQLSQIGALYSFGEKQEYVSPEKLPDLLRLNQAKLVAF